MNFNTQSNIKPYMDPSQYDFGVPDYTTKALSDLQLGGGNNATAYAFDPNSLNFGVDSPALQDFNYNFQPNTNAVNIAGSTPQKAPPEFWSMEGAFGGKSNLGWLTGGAQAITGLAGAYTGLKQLGLAEDSFDFQKQAFNTNLENQARLTNEQLRREQAGRNARNPNEVVDLDAYMKQYGVQGARNA